MSEAHARAPRRQTKSKNQNPSGPAADTVPGLAVRQTAARLLGAVIDKATSLDALTDAEHGHPAYLALDARDRSLVRAILATALRFRRTIETLIDSRLDRPLPPNAAALRHILHVAAAQILFLDVPDSAAVDLAVTQAHADPRGKRFAGLVNAVLRELARRKVRSLPAALAGTIDCPDWLFDRLVAAYGAERASAIASAHRIEASNDFTVRSDPAAWAEQFGGIVLPTGSVRVARLPGAVTDLPGFSDGRWWVQDAAAALPVRLLGDVRGLQVGDLCAAPGGKTAQLADAGASVTAIDLSASRLARLRTNLDRLGLTATIVQSDLFAFRPETPFDAVLIDAPCSSTGTIRRHPDVAWTRTPEDVAKLADLQRRMVLHAATLVKPGGAVVFSNCSLDPLEGERVAESIPLVCPDLRADRIEAGEIVGLDGFLTPEGWLRTTPADLDCGEPQISGMDGFFAARFRRIG